MEQKDYRLAAIMYTDIVGFSRMMEQDEAGTLKLLSFHNQLVTGITERYHGSVIKTIGDAFLVVFRNTVEALQCAMEIQEELYQHNQSGEEQALLLRIGVHLGDIYFYENDALGEGINIAARLQSFARPGAVCFSQDVYNQVLNKIDFRADKLGKVSLKNITKEIHAYEIVSRNSQFDPNRDKPRPGYKAKDLLGQDTAESTAGRRTSTTDSLSGTAAPKAEQPEDQQPNRSYSAEASQKLLQEIRLAILKDTQAQGRRLTVEEANQRYGHYGVEAKEVIASLVDKGIITGRQLGKTAAEPQLDQNDLAADIGRAVEGIARAIEGKVSEWQRSHSGAKVRVQDRDLGTKDGAAGSRVEINIQSGSKPEVRVYNEAKTRKQALAEELKRHEREVPTGKWDKELKDSDYFKPGKEDLETDFERYKEKLVDKANRAVGGFVGNLVPYLAVNGLLWFINLRTGGGFLWAAIVSAAWGIGVVSNLFAVLRNKQKAAEIQRLPSMDGEVLDSYKKLNRVRDSMANHTASMLTVPVLLFTINSLVTSGFWWSLIPIGIMTLSYLGHLAAYPGSKRSLTQKIFRHFKVRSWGELFNLKKFSQRARQAAGQYADVYTEAVRVKEEITRLVKNDKSQLLDKDMVPTLNQYVDQVKLLTQSVNEIDQIVATIPLGELAKDKASLTTSLNATDNPGLQGEYRKSIAEIERQEQACKDLNDQKELLCLRMRSSVNALKQLKIDIARLKTMPESANQAAGQQLRDKASELTRYLEDLKTGYNQVSEDPFAELERMSLEAAKLPPKPEPQ